MSREGERAYFVLRGILPRIRPGPLKNFFNAFSRHRQGVFSEGLFSL